MMNSKFLKGSHLNALVLNRKDGLFMHIQRITNDSLPSFGFNIHVYELTDGMPANDKDAFSAFKYELTLADGKSLNEYWNGELYFVHNFDKDMNCPKMHQVHLLQDLDLYGKVLTCSDHMLKGFFHSNKYKRYVKSHDRNAKLEAKIKHEEAQVSMHQKRINDMKQQLKA